VEYNPVQSELHLIPFNLNSGNALSYHNIDFKPHIEIGNPQGTSFQSSPRATKLSSEARMSKIISLQKQVEKMSVTMNQIQESLALTQCLISKLLEGATSSYSD
jgi:hypothetical protein